MMSENKSSSKTDKKRSGSPLPSPIATSRATGADTRADTVTAADTVLVTAKRRMVLGGGGRVTVKTAATTTASTTWQIIPVPILILTFQFLNQPGLMKASTVSKQWHRIIHTNPGMAQHRILPVLEISASTNKNDKGRSVRLMEWFVANRNKLQRYRVLQLLDVNKFDWEEIFRRFHLDGIVSLDLSSPSKLSRVNCNILHQLSFRLPNVREINLSNIGGEGFDSVLGSFATRCPRLEIITWNNIDIDCDIYMNGCDMRKATNLREIMMDGAVFTGILSDLENLPDFYLFCCLESQVLERISIRHARYDVHYHETCESVPQNALIKYIRNAPPSLRWFRSDLSKDNIEMLRLERPGIEFLN